MPTPREQVISTVDELIAAGRIDASMKDQYIQLLAGNDIVAKEFGEMLLRGSDYTKKTMSLAEARRQQEASFVEQQQQLAAERQQLKNWQLQAEAEINRLRSIEGSTPELAAKIAAYETTLRNYNLLDAVQVPTIPVTAPQPFQAPIQASSAPAQQKYLTRDDAAAFAQEMLEQQRTAFMINNRHMQLFGEPLLEDVVGTAIRTGQDPESYWKTKYAVDQKLSEIEATRAAKEREKMRAEIEAEVLNKYAMDPSRVVGYSGQPQATSPFAEAYMASKALEYAPTSEGTKRPPEQVPDIQASRSRIAEASRFFNSEFAPDGSPLQRGGPAS